MSAPRSRRTTLASTSVLAFSVLAFTAIRAQTQTIPAPRPDIVVIMADDLDVASLDVAIEHGWMPNLVRYVLEEGTRFTESFVTESLCCPSRSTFLTGLYPHNHGVIRNTGRAGGFDVFHEHFRQSAPLATWLQASGYRTAHVGKYLNGYTDYTVVPHGWTEWRALVDASTYCMYNYKVSRNGTTLVDFGRDAAEPPEEYQTDVLAAMADEIVANGDEQPLFLSIAPLAPHLETACAPQRVRPAPRHAGSVALSLPAPPSLNEADTSDKPRWMRDLPLVDIATLERRYNDRIASLRAIDDLIGTVASALERKGRLDRTAFLFTSDNGYLLGLHRWQSKILLYEESIRVPLALKVPAGIAGASARSVGRLALNTDLAPTIVDLARATPTFVMDGRSLLPLLRDPSRQWRSRFLIEYPPVSALGAAGQETLGLDFETPEDPGTVASAVTLSTRLPPFRAVRAGDATHPLRLVYGETTDLSGGRVTDRELYDLETDPFQLESLHRDLSPVRVEQRRALKRDLDRLGACGGGTCQSREE